jgi:hypothetical protein
MKKYTLSIILILLMGTTVFSRDFDRKIAGKWDILKITNRSGTQTIPQNATAVWEFRSDGTGQVNLVGDEEQRDFNFKWSLEDNVILLTDEKGPIVEKIHFGFFDDYLFILKAPDDNILLKRHVEKAPGQDK